MTNLMDIQKQIEKLRKQADEIRAKDCEKTIDEIIGKMEAYGITVKDLQSAMSRGKRKSAVKSARTAGKTAKNTTRTVAVKYRGPNGEAWTGRGLPPRWLSALIAQGRTREEFAVDK